MTTDEDTAASMPAHYFAFSRVFVDGRRLCGECRLNYDVGDHIEVTDLKPRTHYVCPTGGGLGHSSIYTGNPPPELRSPRDAFCSCGARFVEEDSETWQLSYELWTPIDPEWHTVTVVRSRHAAELQRDGLLELAAQGEPIRNVHLSEVGLP